MLQVTPVNALRDNYIWLIHGQDDPRDVVIVDPGEAAPVEVELAARSLQPRAIFVTHHHRDHTGAVAGLAARFGIPVFGPGREAQSIVTQPLRDGDMARPVNLEFQAIEIPGHTLGHIAFYGHGALFCGDTLFSAGCGRLFEGTAEQMANSLKRLAALPAGTEIYCGHEYTLANLRFAAEVEPQNESIRGYRQAAAALRERNRPTLPSRVGLELAVNPFLRTSESGVRRAAERWSGEQLDDNVRVFAALRRWKDEYQ
jgi:hydroxyacylglutathione hydrolase